MKKFIGSIGLLLILLLGVRSEAKVEDLYDFEIRVAPIVLLVKWVSVEGAFRINEHLDIGVNGLFFGENVDYDRGSIFFPVYEGYSVGLNANYYFSGLQNLHSWYFSGKLNHNDYKHVGHNTPVREDEGASLIAILGFRTPIVVLSTQLSILMGLGIQQTFFDRIERDRIGSAITETRGDYNRVIPYAEFKLAYQF